VRGRKKLTTSDGFGVEVWLKSYLSGGHRSANEVVEVGKLQGFSRRTLRRAKAQLGIKSDHRGGGSLWYWYDPKVEAPKVESADKLDILIHEVKEAKRLAQAPRVMTEDGPVVAPDLIEVDDLGYRKHGALPMSQATVQVTDVLREIKRLSNAGIDHSEVVTRIFEYAYPAAGLPESVLAAMLKANGIVVPPKKPKLSQDVVF
jgi:hypothetical protein